MQYANICARAVRNSLKDELRTPALARDYNGLKYAKWENGVQQEGVSEKKNDTHLLVSDSVGHKERKDTNIHIPFLSLFVIEIRPPSKGTS